MSRMFWENSSWEEVQRSMATDVTGRVGCEHSMSPKTAGLFCWRESRGEGQAYTLEPETSPPPPTQIQVALLGPWHACYKCPFPTPLHTPPSACPSSTSSVQQPCGGGSFCPSFVYSLAGRVRRGPWAQTKWVLEAGNPKS